MFSEVIENPQWESFTQGGELVLLVGEKYQELVSDYQDLKSKKT